MPAPLRTILFDLDGTLLDTAPDIVHALNRLRSEEGLPLLPHAALRPVVSHGTSAMIQAAFDLAPHDERFAHLRQRFLDLYGSRLAHDTCFFPGMAEVLLAIESRGLNWGVVTNKPAFLTNPIMEQMGLYTRAACVVSGDTTAERKPHPAPMLYACAAAGSAADACLYVGDAQRDIEAGRRAGMRTLVALFGYLSADDQPELWGADGMIDTAEELVKWL